MSAAAQTKIFGIKLGVDPKILVLGLVAIAGALFWYNSRGEDETSSVAGSHVPAAQSASPTTLRTHPGRTRRPTTAVNDRGSLRVRPIDASSGNVDPTLRLGLLARLQNLEPPAGERNIFEAGPDPIAAAQAAAQIKAPKIVPGPVQPPSYPQLSSGPPPINIPLKYYGFAKSADSTPNSGFFLDGDNVLVASEGELLQKRYLVVELNARSAKLEDTEMKQSQTLQVVPEAAEQQ